jgi:hypothetical protein
MEGLLVLLGRVCSCSGVLDLLYLVLCGHGLPGHVCVFHVFSDLGLRTLCEVVLRCICWGVCASCICWLGGQFSWNLWYWRLGLVIPLLKPSLRLCTDP